MAPAPAPDLAIDADRLRRLFDKAPGFMVMARGPDHVFEMVNAAYVELVGHRDLIGKSVREAFPELEGTGFFEVLDEVYRTGTPRVGHAAPIRLKRTAGGPIEERMLDYVFQPIIEDGAVAGIFVEGNDVTEQQQAMAALRESEERFRLIADSAPVLIWVTRPDRKRGFVNRAYVDFLGMSYEEAVDFEWRTLLHPDDHDRIVAESIAGESSLVPFTLEARYRRCDDKWRWMRSTSQPRLGPAGEYEGFIGVAHDITEAKEAEAALREINETLERKVAERTADLSSALNRLQAEAAERQRFEDALRQAQKMEAVGQLTGGIAHDFNNLLTPIMGGLEIIAKRGSDDPRMKRIAENALESARRGAKLASQLLAFSRVQRISMAPVAVNRLIANVDDLIRHALGGRIWVRTRLASDVGFAICDANQLDNAILNLALNARDAMPDGGEFTVSTACVHCEAAPDLAAGNYVEIACADTGQGMAPDVLARATEPFFSTKPMGRGTGLGLSQVYGIASQSGGALRIESEPGSGTRVIMLLPVAEGAVHEDTAGEGDQVAIDGDLTEAATVMVVDDDTEVRTFLAESLQAIGYQVVTAADGTEALGVLGEADPSLLLLDFAMPAINGADVARAVRRTHPRLPIVFVTGFAETSQLEAAMGAECAILRKPFSVAELAATVKQHLAQG